jgi:hypothetical protein
MRATLNYDDLGQCVSTAAPFVGISLEDGQQPTLPKVRCARHLRGSMALYGRFDLT